MKTSKLEFWRTLKMIGICTAERWTLELIGGSYTVEAKAIRYKDTGLIMCPVCAVANAILGTRDHRLNVHHAARAIGLDKTFADQVAKAADNEGRCKITRGIRKQVLRALGF